MSNDVLCGRCGTALDSPSATCRNCGAKPVYQPTSSHVHARKSPWLAVLRAAAIPGLGHIYLGHYKKGLFYLVAAGGLEFLGFDLDLTAIGAALGVPMGLGGLGLWAHGVYDAWRIARSMDQPVYAGSAVR